MCWVRLILQEFGESIGSIFSIQIREDRLHFQLGTNCPYALIKGTASTLPVAAGQGRRPSPGHSLPCQWSQYRRIFSLEKASTGRREQPPRGGIGWAEINVLHKYGWESEGEAVRSRRTQDTCDLPPADAGKKWYAVHTRSRHEKVVAAQLRGRGVDTYLPLVENLFRRD